MPPTACASRRGASGLTKNQNNKQRTAAGSSIYAGQQTAANQDASIFAAGDTGTVCSTCIVKSLESWWALTMQQPQYAPLYSSQPCVVGPREFSVEHKLRDLAFRDRQTLAAVTTQPQHFWNWAWPILQELAPQRPLSFYHILVQGYYSLHQTVTKVYGTNMTSKTVKAAVPLDGWSPSMLVGFRSDATNRMIARAAKTLPAPSSSSMIGSSSALGAAPPTPPASSSPRVPATSSSSAVSNKAEGKAKAPVRGYKPYAVPDGSALALESRGAAAQKARATVRSSALKSSPSTPAQASKTQYREPTSTMVASSQSDIPLATVHELISEAESDWRARMARMQAMLASKETSSQYLGVYARPSRDSWQWRFPQDSQAVTGRTPAEQALVELEEFHCWKSLQSRIVLQMRTFPSPSTKEDVRVLIEHGFEVEERMQEVMERYQKALALEGGTRMPVLMYSRSSQLPERSGHTWSDTLSSRF